MLCGFHYVFGGSGICVFTHCSHNIKAKCMPNADYLFSKRWLSPEDRYSTISLFDADITKQDFHRIGQGLFKFSDGVVVPEASSRYGPDFYTVPADHNSICRPRNKKDRRFCHLTHLIKAVTTLEVSWLNALLKKGSQTSFTQPYDECLILNVKHELLYVLKLSSSAI